MLTDGSGILPLSETDCSSKPGPNVSAENRKDPRREIERPVTIKLSIPAVLQDISRSGARLLIDSSATLPNEFMLELSGELRRWCRIVWRSEKQVGVQYISTPPGAGYKGQEEQTASAADS